MNRIALFLPNWIGDVVMATPAIRAVRERFPQACLFAVCKPYVSAILEGSRWFDDVILYDKTGPTTQRFVSVVKRLRSEPCDAAVLFPNSFRAALVARLGGCRRRIGFARYGRSFLLTDRLQPITDERGRLIPAPIIDDYNRLVAPLGITDPGHRMELFTTSKDDDAATKLWTNLGLERHHEVIGLNSGGAFGAAKQWPIEHFARLAREFVDRRGSGVLVLCGPNERALARQIVQQAERSSVVSLADQDVSLGLTKACVRKLDLLVTTDSGPRHFAAAFDKPVVTLYGPTFIEWTETYFLKAIHKQIKVDCGPCQKRVCPLDHRCMRNLEVADVWRASTNLLRRYPPLAGGLRHAG
ncbi:MAG: lipopolysaccharide heptosyltransferase II [Planctomycetes bacterium]|nr:lipopolysaccharide heptosyltransferase II [Planctomycetota bacterium]